MNSVSADRIGWTLIHFLWQGTAVAALLGLALLATRRKSASLRYGLSCVAMLCLAVCPIATYLWLGAQNLFQVSGQSGGSKIDSGLVNHWMPGAAHLAPQPNLFDMKVIVWIWITGVAVLTIRLLGGLIQVERMRRGSTPIGADWQTRLDDLARRIGHLKPVRLMESAKIDTPVAMGVLRAAIILPCSLTLRLSALEVEAILLHELAHLRRHDYLVNIAQTVIETALFYHPAVWWISRTIRIERENCCDDLAASASASRLVYVRALTALEQFRGAAPNLSMSAKGGRLVTRINRILGTPDTPVARPRVWPLLAMALTLTAVLGTVVQSEAQDKAPEPSKVETKVAPPHKLTIAHQPVRPHVSTLALSKPSGTAVKSLPKQLNAKPAIVAMVVTPKAVSATKTAAVVPHRDAPPKASQVKATVTGDFLMTPFPEAMQAIGRESGISFVVGYGVSTKVSVKLSNVPVIEAINAVCYAANASWRKQGDIYYFEKRGDDPTITDRITLHLGRTTLGEAVDRVAGLLGARIVLAVDKRIGVPHVDLDSATVEDAMFYVSAFAGRPGSWHLQDGVYTITEK